MRIRGRGGYGSTNQMLEHDIGDILVDLNGNRLQTRCDVCYQMPWAFVQAETGVGVFQELRGRAPPAPRKTCELGGLIEPERRRRGSLPTSSSPPTVVHSHRARAHVLFGSVVQGLHFPRLIC